MTHLERIEDDVELDRVLPSHAVVSSSNEGVGYAYGCKSRPDGQDREVVEETVEAEKRSEQRDLDASEGCPVSE
jgi:hypothetical protein